MTKDNYDGRGRGRGRPVKESSSVVAVDEIEDPLVRMFAHIAEKVDERHREVDTVIHMSRQITYDSKRVVSKILGYFQNSKVLRYAKASLKDIITKDEFFRGLAMRLYYVDPRYYHRYYTPAIQEFIEAAALLMFFKEGRLLKYEEVQKMLTYKLRLNDEGVEGDDEKPEVTYEIPFTKTDYYLGVADVTGELVRACITGYHTDSFRRFMYAACALVRNLYQCLYALYPCPGGVIYKLNTMRSSLIKLETACYHSKLQMVKYAKITGFDPYAYKVGNEWHRQEDDENKNDYDYE